MKKNLLKVIFPLCLIMLIAACKKDDEGISTTPEIEFVSVTPNSVVEYQDSLVFTISYRDGDADLGENGNGVDNFFLTDSRNSVTYKFRIQQLAPDDANVPIQGKLNVVLQSTALLNEQASETVTYSMYIVDRAGNQSNTVTSSPVTITVQ